MGALGAKILANQAADTAVMTPLTIAAGVAEGKEGREISADVAKQQLMDLGFNIGMGAAGEGLKALKGMRTTAKAEKEARAAARSAERAAEAERLKNNQTQRKLIKGEDLPASLFDEYKNLTNSDWVDARLQEVHQKYKTDESITKEMMKLDARREELEEMLGISTPKVQRMQKQLKNNSIKKAKDILNLSGKEASAENTAMIGKAIREASASGRISKETREEIFEYLFAKGRAVFVPLCLFDEKYAGTPHADRALFQPHGISARP
jgi:hypothetical protein